MTVTREDRLARRRAREESTARVQAAITAARTAVAVNACPECGRPLCRNSAIAGWWQCSQFGAEGFRADATQPSCNWQGFTE